MKKGLMMATALVTLGIGGSFVVAQNTGFNEKTAISASEAKEAALKAFKGTVIDFEFEHDETPIHYEFTIQNEQEEADVSVDALTGKVTIEETEVIDQSISEQAEAKAGAISSAAKIKINNATVDNSLEKQSEETSALLSKAQALTIAYTVAKGTVTKVELDDNVFEIDLRDGNTVFEIEIDAFTGKIIEQEQETISNTAS